MHRFLLLLAVASVCLSCRREREDPIRVACVGDSITEGLNIARRGQPTYPEALKARAGRHWHVANFGVGGATLLRRGDRPYQEQRAYREALAFRPHGVVIKLGSNDSKPHNWMHGGQFVGDYLALIRAFQALDSRPKVWICTPAPVFSEAYEPYDEIIREEIRPAVREVGRRAGVPVIDLYAALEDQGHLFPDRVHPNAEGAERIAQAIYSVVGPALDRRAAPAGSGAPVPRSARVTGGD